MGILTTEVSDCKDDVQPKHGRCPRRVGGIVDIVGELDGSSVGLVKFITMVESRLFLVGGGHVGWQEVKR